MSAFDTLGNLLASAKLRAKGVVSGDTELLAVADNADGLVSVVGGLLRVVSESFVFNGVSFDRLRSPAKFVRVSALAIVAGTPVAVWTPAGGKKFRLMGYSLSASVAGLVLFEDASGAPNEFLRVGAGVPGTVPPSTSPPLGNGFLSAVANNALFLDVSASATLNGYVFGCEE